MPRAKSQRFFFTEQTEAESQTKKLTDVPRAESQRFFIKKQRSQLVFISTDAESQTESAPILQKS